jgi:hypothetical protein
MKQSNKERDIAISLAKRELRELISIVQRSRRGSNWKPAPRDPGIRSGGIRGRAKGILAARSGGIGAGRTR